jgi:hypothetical protein
VTGNLLSGNIVVVVFVVVVDLPRGTSYPRKSGHNISARRNSVKLGEKRDAATPGRLNA